jgi:HK97 family phage major capsid protein
MPSTTAAPSSETPLQQVERLRHERADLLADLDKIVKRSEREGRDLYPDEEKRFNQLDGEIVKKTARIEALEREHDLGSKITRATISGVREPEPEHEGAGLASSQRMVDWARARGADDLPGDGYVNSSQEFRLGRAIQGMVTGQWNGADRERRALAEGTDSAGGFLTPEVLGAQVIDRVRKRAKVIEAGATVVPMESDKHYVPRLATGVTGAWKAENAPVTESDPTFERVTLSAKTLAVAVKLSYELFDDLTDEGARIIENELAQSLGLELDRAALRGSGTGQEPTGIRNQSGVTIQSLATNGAVPNYSALVNAAAAIQAANLEPNGHIYSSRTAKTLSTLVDSTGQPLRKPPLVDELPVYVSNQVPENLTHGTSNVASEICTADWSQLLIGVRPRVRIQATTTRGSEAGFPINVKASSDYAINTMSVYLLAWIRADVQLAHPEGFVVTTGVTAA